MSFNWSGQRKNLSIFTPRYFTEFDRYSLFPVSLILISPESTFLGDASVRIYKSLNQGILLSLIDTVFLR